MSFQSILSGLLATYLVVTPCLAIQHGDTSVSGNQVAVAASQDGHGHSHSHTHSHGEDSEGSENEHCCDDLSSSLHAPVKEIPSVAFVAIVPPSFEVPNPYNHVRLHTALSRDGPIYEQARENAKTIVILS